MFSLPRAVLFSFFLTLFASWLTLGRKIVSTVVKSFPFSPPNGGSLTGFLPRLTRSHVALSFRFSESTPCQVTGFFYFPSRKKTFFVSEVPSMPRSGPPESCLLRSFFFCLPKDSQPPLTFFFLGISPLMWPLKPRLLTRMVRLTRSFSFFQQTADVRRFSIFSHFSRRGLSYFFFC